MHHPTPEILATIAGKHSAWIGQTGSGKTYGAKAAIVEPALKAGRRMVIIDPTSVWWGLRNGRDGKGLGFPVTIFGGKHGDFPLDARSGQALGELVARENVPAIMDVRHFTVGERTRWTSEFCEALLRSNTDPLTVVMDEAHKFAPQARSLDPQGAMMLHQVESLASGGRVLGVRLVLITQRPAKLHKDVLTSCSAMAAFRVVAPQDRDAIREWIDGCGDRDKGREVIDSLAGLKDGECWLWDPKAKYLERVQMPRITTFDSSATPDDDTSVPPPSVLSGKLMEQLREKLGRATAEAEANDPKTLRAKVASLQKQLAEKVPASKVAPSVDVQAVVEKAVAAERKRLRNGMKSALALIATTLKGHRAQVVKLAEISESCDTLVREIDALRTLLEAEPAPVEISPLQKTLEGLGAQALAGAKVIQEAFTSRTPVSGKRTPAQRVLDSLLFWKSIGDPTPCRAKVGIVAGVNASGGYFDNVVGPLAADRKIDRRSGFLTLEAPGEPEAQDLQIRSLSDYHQHIKSQVKDRPSLKILDVLIEGGRGAEFTRKQIGEAAGVNPSGGYFDNCMAPLSRLGLVERRAGVVSGTDVLFPRGLE